MCQWCVQLGLSGHRITGRLQFHQRHRRPQALPPRLEMEKGVFCLVLRRCFLCRRQNTTHPVNLIRPLNQNSKPKNLLKKVSICATGIPFARWLFWSVRASWNFEKSTTKLEVFPFAPWTPAFSPTQLGCTSTGSYHVTFVTKLPYCNVTLLCSVLSHTLQDLCRMNGIWESGALSSVSTSHHQSRGHLGESNRIPLPTRISLICSVDSHTITRLMLLWNSPKDD